MDEDSSFGHEANPNWVQIYYRKPTFFYERLAKYFPLRLLELRPMGDLSDCKRGIVGNLLSLKDEVSRNSGRDLLFE